MNVARLSVVNIGRLYAPPPFPGNAPGTNFSWRTTRNYQRDALNIIYSSNIITLLYMFRVSSTHLQQDIVVYKQHMVPSLCKRWVVKYY